MSKRHIRYSSRFMLSYLLGLFISFPLGLLFGVVSDEFGLDSRKAMACAMLCSGRLCDVLVSSSLSWY